MNREYETTLDLEDLGELEDPEEFEALEMEDLEDFETLDLEDLSELEDLEDFEALEMEGLGELEDLEEFKDWQVAPPRRRGRRPITMPPVHIRVRPADVLDRFDHNKDALKPHHPPKIKLVANRVITSWRRRSSRPGRGINSIRLVGHTDSTGPASYNLGLGKRRAKTVMARLIPAIRAEFKRQVRRLGRRAFPPRIRIRLTPQTLGEKKPVANNGTAAGRARNRRVAIFVARV